MGFLLRHSERLNPAFNRQLRGKNELPNTHGVTSREEVANLRRYAPLPASALGSLFGASAPWSDTRECFCKIQPAGWRRGLGLAPGLRRGPVALSIR
jgi:hypothetical protein